MNDKIAQHIIESFERDLILLRNLDKIDQSQVKWLGTSLRDELAKGPEFKKDQNNSENKPTKDFYDIKVNE